MEKFITEILTTQNYIKKEKKMIIEKSRICKKIIEENIIKDDETMFLEKLYLEFLEETVKKMKYEELVKTIIDLDKYKNELETIIEMFYFEKIQKKLKRRKK